MRRPIVVGNWKMNTLLSEASQLVAKLRDNLAGVTEVEVGVCPPFVYLPAVNEALKGSNIGLGAQNVYFQEKGAFTGEVSAAMLKDVGCKYVIIGHSERRTIMAENDDIINKKLKAVLGKGLIPIFCIGETLEQRQEGITERIIRSQIDAGLDGITSDDIAKTVIAYEPVWAIGTGKNATPQQAQEVHLFIRKLIAHITSDIIARDIQIIYGGSVKAENAQDILSQSDIDGALVGGASLDAEAFTRIVQSAKR
ncbi:MAG: triose-phosphate isomerase [Planctomycetes bacterium]|nr:triose-phosphate isomerase [Planctomycetota bacterium]